MNPYILIYLGALVAGLILSEDLKSGFKFVSNVSKILFIYYISSLAIQIEPEEKRTDKAIILLFSFISGMFILNLIGLAQFTGLIGQSKYQVLEPMHMHHIWYGNLNAVGLYSSVSILLFTRFKQKLTLFGFILISLPCILFAQSRAVWLGIALTLAIASFIMVRRKRIFFYILLLVLFIFISLYLGSDIFKGRIELIKQDIHLFFAGNPNTSIGARFVMWKMAWKMFLSNPLMGVGTGDYMMVLQRYIKSGEAPAFIGGYNQPHNMFLFLLARNGLVGLSAYLLVFYKAFRLSIPMLGTNRLFGFLIFAVLTHFLLASLTDSTTPQAMTYSFALMLGICLRSGSKSF